MWEINTPGERSPVSDYNYVNFPLAMTSNDFNVFPTILRAGEQAPDGELINAATGETVKLSDYWSNGPVMIEFGSIT